MKAKWILIAVAVVLVVGAAAGFGGYSFGMQAGQAQAQNTRAAFLAARGGAGSQSGAPGAAANGAGFPGQGAGQNGGGQFNPANFTVGQVKQIDGNTIQLSTATEVLKVKVGDQTRIQKMGTGSLSDIQAGDRVTVQGTRASDGTFTAQTIQIGGGRPAGGNPPEPQATPSGN